jgi:hypothetical protein
MAREEGVSGGVNQKAFNSSTFPPILKEFFKGPRPFKQQKTFFERLNNFEKIPETPQLFVNISCVKREILVFKSVRKRIS